jgi:nucleoside-diphosphate-sugar epimerase
VTLKSPSRIDSLLITGSNGFVGQSFLDYLSTLPLESRPREVALVTRGPKISVPRGLEFEKPLVHFQADLLQPWVFVFPATHVLHLAADGSAESYSQKAADSFVAMASHLAKWSSRLECPTVFHASSGACFDGPEVASLKSDFVNSRLAAEGLLRQVGSEELIDLRIGRLFSFIGRHIYQKPQYAVPSFVRMAIEEKVISMQGNPSTTRSYLSANDMSEWIYKSFLPDLDDAILAIGSEKPVTMTELAEYIAGKTGSEVLFLNPFIDGDYYVADNQETRVRLQVEEKTPWQTSIDRYLEDYLEMRADERG